MSISYFDNNLAMVHNANVELHKRDKSVSVIINDIFKTELDKKSAIFQALQNNDILDVQQRLSGGSYFVQASNDSTKNDELITYRNRDYKGFIHSDDNIRSLIEHIGVNHGKNRKHFRNTSSQHVQLSNVYSRENMNIITSGGDGTEIDSQLSYNWDPFQSHIRASYEIIRLICTNGMVGMTNFMNTKIPIVNEWTQHMEIASKQLQNKIGSVINTRVKQMTLSQSRASVRDCQRVVEACMQRYQNPLKTAEEVRHIKAIGYAADPTLHLGKHYSSSVFNDKRLSEQSASHLTEFTLWNMLTELATHTAETDSSSNSALHKHANDLMFDRFMRKTVVNSSTGVSIAHNAKYDDIDAAFIGEMAA